MTEFFLSMIPPTVTHQEHKVTVVKGKPVFYDPPELKAARQKLEAHLAGHVPDKPYKWGLQLIVKWCFPIPTIPKCKHINGEYKTTKPDTDNLNKMLKDVMTSLHFWDDDAQVASEIIEKFWADIPGIYIKIIEMG